MAPNLILIGFMATGKTTIGRHCACALGFRFRDSDSLVERRAGKSIAAIFEEVGEPAFRAMETTAIRDLTRQAGLVIATGGGAPMNPANAASLRHGGVVVLLHASPEEILRRVGNRRSRPLLADAEDPAARIRAMLAQRDPVYRAIAHAVVEVNGLSRAETSERVLAAYRVLSADGAAGVLSADQAAGDIEEAV